VTSPDLGYDKAKSAIQDVVDMPDRLIDLFIRVCIENNGCLSKKKRKTTFAKLTDEEVAKMETCVQEAFRPTERHSIGGRAMLSG